MKLPNGIAVGPFYFSKDGKTASGLIGPAIIPFDFGLAGVINRLPKEPITIDEIQTEFNSLVDSLISETLIYFQNRLKPIVKGSTGNFNSIDIATKAYAKVGINIRDLCDLAFLDNLSDVRGRKHHTDRRYDSDYTVHGVSYDTAPKLRQLAEKVRAEIHAFDDKLGVTNKDYKVEVKQKPGQTSVSFTAINHAIDLTRGAKIVPKKQDQPANSDLKNE